MDTKPPVVGDGGDVSRGPALAETNEARLRALIDNVPGAIYRCANDGAWTMAVISDEIERISGYPASDFIDSSHRTFASVIHPDDRGEVERMVAEAVAHRRPFALEYRIVRPGGEIRWVLERGQLSEVSARAWLDGVIFDITDRRRGEEALREGEKERIRLEEVRASRARLVEAADAERRRLERDLHDGAQQRLVSLALTLRMARGQIEAKGADAGEAAGLLDDAISELEAATAELRELARGMHPVLLSDRGLGPAVLALAERAPLPIAVSVDATGSLPAPVESTAYFVVAEALTNVARYARASGASVEISSAEGGLQVTVRDDGVGGADPARGSGLRGLADRVAALDGLLRVDSRDGGGTLVRAEIPYEAPAETSR